MNRTQKLTWLLIGLQLLALACATSWIDDASGARTLARAAVAMMIGISIAEFWNAVPTISRCQARLNRIHWKFARRAKT